MENLNLTGISRRARKLILALTLLTSISQAHAAEPCAADLSTPRQIVTAQELKKRIEIATIEILGTQAVTTRAYIKDVPVIGWKIASPRVMDLPAAIQAHLGRIDATSYGDDISQYVGSYIMLQSTRRDGQLLYDFYPVGKNTFVSSYQEVPVTSVEQKNPKLVADLNADPAIAALIAGPNQHLSGLLKTTQVEMYRASDIGFSIDQPLEIESPWGTQTKPKGRDAFLVWEAKRSMYYMVNADDQGLPISYMPVSAQQPSIRVTSADLTKTVVGAQRPTTNYMKDLPILGFRNSGVPRSQLPSYIHQLLGNVDAIDYSDEALAANAGSVFAIQAKGTALDVYMISISTFQSDYREVPVSDVEEKNRKVWNAVQNYPALASALLTDSVHFVGALKTVSVAMTRMSDLGYSVDHEITIEGPWGDQTKPAGKDAFLVWDTSASQYYMVNSESNGLPIGYIHE